MFKLKKKKAFENALFCCLHNSPIDHNLGFLDLLHSKQLCALCFLHLTFLCQLFLEDILTHIRAEEYPNFGINKS